MGIFRSRIHSSAFAGVIYFVGTLAIFVISIWVSLELWQDRSCYEDESIHCLHLNIHNLRYNLGAFHGASWWLCLFSW